MPLDKEAVLRTAEKLLRQGRLDGAIEQYVQLIDAYPRDWNAINALGDLYVRAGDADRALAQFVRVADFLYAEGFLPKANALYKKALKVRPRDEHTLSRLAEIAARHGLLADAKQLLRQLAQQRQERGDTRGAAECLVRLGEIDADDGDARVAAGRAAQTLGDTGKAVALLQEAAAIFEKHGEWRRRLEVLEEVAGLAPHDGDVRQQLARALVEAGDLEGASRYLSPAAAGDDPRMLLVAGRLELAAGRSAEGRAVLMRVLMLAPDRAPEILAIGETIAATGNLDEAFGCVELVVDAALFEADFERAATTLEQFLRHGHHVAALAKLVEVCVDAGFTERMRAAQARLVEALHAAGRHAEAAAVAADLEQPLRPGGDLDLDLDDLEPGDASGSPREEAGLPDPVPAPPAPAEAPVPSVSRPADEVRVVEIDLSGALTTLGGVVPAPVPLETVFDRLRAQAAESGGVDWLEQADAHLLAGRTPEAVAALQEAARLPQWRFRAASMLGRVHLERGDLHQAIEWLERAAEAPADGPEAGRDLLYELASALERAGEPARALAVLMEIDAEQTGFRDVGARIALLTRADA